MNFIVSSSALLKQLSRISGVIPTKSVVPITENFLFDITAGNLALSTTNLEISMQTSLKVETRGESVKVAVPSKILLDILRALPDQPVTISIDEDNFGIELSSDNGKYKLSGENGLDFPKIPSPEKTNKTEMPVSTLLRAIGKTLFAASSEEDKTALNGIFISLSPDGITFAATDAHRLVRYRRVDVRAKDTASFIVPHKAMNLVKSSFVESDELVKIDYNDSNAFFRTSDLLLVCRLIDQRYPDYENVIPTANPGKLTVDRKEILGAVRRVNIFANKASHQVRFRISGNELTVSSEDFDLANEAKETLKCHYEGEDMEIGFNAALLEGVIANGETEDLLIELSTPNRAGIILPTSQYEGENLLMLVMPVMLNTYVGA